MPRAGSDHHQQTHLEPIHTQAGAEQSGAIELCRRGVRKERPTLNADIRALLHDDSVRRVLRLHPQRRQGWEFTYVYTVEIAHERQIHDAAHLHRTRPFYLLEYSASAPLLRRTELRPRH